LTTIQEAGAVEPDRRRLRARVEAEAYVASVCFKHGPPKLLGVELEWTVHHRDDPARRLDQDHLVAALGPHVPRTLRQDSPQAPLPAGSPLTIEPGGQVEISSLPEPSLGPLLDTVSADISHLTALLADAGLVLGNRGLDPHRSPRRVLDTPRYAAMERAFDPIGPDGITMMCATAGLQVCLDVGERSDVAARFAAVSSLGPVLVALFGNSPLPGWHSARTRAVLAVDPSRSSPLPIGDDPASDWAGHVLDTELLFVRRPGPNWDAPPGVTFADWIAGALPEPPTRDDLVYHMSSMFPPVRPHGYLEVRYLDAQDGADWIAPAALLTALMADPGTVDAVVEACAPAARRVLDLGVPALDRLDLGPADRARVADRLSALRDRADHADRTDTNGRW
jgi:glutamate--cysteine ligase